MLGKAKHSITDIKNLHHGHFFDPDTMKFFGDRLTSYKVVNWQGDDIMYRKPGATVNVFGSSRTVTKKDYFSSWRFNPDNGDLSSLSNEEETEFLTLI